MDAVYPGNLESFPRCFTLEDLGNLWGEAEKKIFLEFEPQLAVLRQLLNIQNRALKTTAKVAKKVAKNALRD